MLLTGQENNFGLITFSVVTIHAIFLLLFYYQSFQINKTIHSKSPRNAIAIQTIELNPIHSTPNRKQETQPIQRNLTEKVAPRPPTPPKPASKTPPKAPPKAPPTNQKPTSTAKQQLLAKAQESLNKVQSNQAIVQSSVPKPNLNSPKTLGKLQSDSMILSGNALNGSKEAYYQDKLLNQLKFDLRLIEYGDVDLELTLNRLGQVVFVKIIKSDNQKNRQYVEKTLPTLHFAGFATAFAGEAQHTFVIRLSNE
jgi:cytoskeletal protein RodZ